MSAIINIQTLRERMRDNPPPLLIHVLPEEHFKAGHLPGSVNACVYEVAFDSNVRALAPNPDREIIVYGEGDPYLDSHEAAARLRAAGYRKVLDFRQGLRQWRAAGFTLEGSGEVPSPPLLSGRYQVDTATSIVRWMGRNATNHHSGDLPLASGSIVAENGVLVRVELTGDLTRIRCEDLADPHWNALLIAHLKSADFFHVNAYPTASFVSTHIAHIGDTGEGRPNVRIAGSLRLRGTEAPIEFTAALAPFEENKLALQAMVTLDRTQWGSIYGSSRFFAYLGKHLVNDEFHLHIKVHAGRPIA